MARRANARSEDPATSLLGTEGIRDSHTDLLIRFLAAHDRPEGWTSGELRDHTELAHAAVWRRISDARNHRHAIEVVTRPDGSVVTRTDPATRRAQQAYRISAMYLPVPGLGPQPRGDFGPASMRRWSMLLNSQGERGLARLAQEAAAAMEEAGISRYQDFIARRASVTPDNQTA